MLIGRLNFCRLLREVQSCALLDGGYAQLALSHYSCAQEHVTVHQVFHSAKRGDFWFLEPIWLSCITMLSRFISNDLPLELRSLLMVHPLKFHKSLK